MFFFKKKKKVDTKIESSDKSPEKSPGIFKRFKSQLSSIFSRKTKIDEDLLEEIETLLLSSDLGVEVTDKVIDNLKQQVVAEKITDPQELYKLLQSILADILKKRQQPLNITKSEHKPFIILMIGVNGAGKTTTIGKLASKFTSEGKKVLLAAGDTFRAAAIEQLQVWGERNNIEVVSQKIGADSAAVIYDAVLKAQAKKFDVVIADTAGRLHTKHNLMKELEKVSRVLKKIDINAPHEVMLVLDASIGQNAMRQVEEFNKAMNITGITLTKLDGTAKGGIIFAIAEKYAIPIRYVGLGEKITDLQRFDSKKFSQAIFDN